MSYQRCPICEGLGVISSRPVYATGTTWNSNNVTECCPTCLGQRIIDTQFGRPPNAITITVKPEQSQESGKE